MTSQIKRALLVNPTDSFNSIFNELFDKKFDKTSVKLDVVKDYLSALEAIKNQEYFAYILNEGFSPRKEEKVEKLSPLLIKTLFENKVEQDKIFLITWNPFFKTKMFNDHGIENFYDHSKDVRKLLSDLRNMYHL